VNLTQAQVDAVLQLALRADPNDWRQQLNARAMREVTVPIIQWLGDEMKRADDLNEFAGFQALHAVFLILGKSVAVGLSTVLPPIGDHKHRRVIAEAVANEIIEVIEHQIQFSKKLKKGK
jgi:hypothetical protein